MLKSLVTFENKHRNYQIFNTLLDQRIQEVDKAKGGPPLALSTSWIRFGIE